MSSSAHVSGITLVVHQHKRGGVLTPFRLTQINLDTVKAVLGSVPPLITCKKGNKVKKRSFCAFRLAYSSLDNAAQHFIRLSPPDTEKAI